MSPKAQLVCLILAALVFIPMVTLTTGTLAEEPVASATVPRQIIIILDNITPQELWSLPCWQGVHRPIAWGLMSPYTPSPPRPLNGYLTLGLGIPVSGVNGDRGQAYRGEELLNLRPVGQIIAQRTGMVTSPDEIYILDLKEQKDNVKKLNSQATFGALGNTLEEAGYTRVILGNSDTLDLHRRYGGYIIADGEGRVGTGVVDGAIQESESFANSYYPTDYCGLVGQFLAAQDGDLIILELGDLARLEASKRHFLNSQWASLRQEYLEQTSQFIGSLWPQLDFATTRVMVIVPNNSLLNPIRTLTPLAMVGKGVEGELVTSPTTKRPGIVSNIDLAPTILSYWDLEVPAFMYGRTMITTPLEGRPTPGPQYLDNILARVNFINTIRPPIIKTFIFSQIIAISFFLLLLLRRNISSTIGYNIFIVTTMVPLSLLVLAYFNITDLSHYLLMWGLSIWVLLVLAYFLSRLFHNDILAIICLMTALAILIDLALGSPLMKHSVLGYDPVRGARFYGLGNEYMGVLVGSLITGLTLFIQQGRLQAGNHRGQKINTPETRQNGKVSNSKKTFYIIVAIFAVTIIFIGSPRLGTNVGGTIAASIGFTVTIVKLAQYRLNPRTLLLTGAVLSTSLLILFIVDSLNPAANQTHIGRLVSSVISQGPGALVTIFVRKITINLRLIRYTNWSLLFLISLVSLLFAFFRPLGMVKELYTNYPYLTSGFIGVLAGSLGALVFNDSGIVAAATMMVFPVNALMYTALRKSQ